VNLLKFGHDIANSVKDVDVQNRKVDVYLAHFDSIDSDNEFFSKGAFTKSIQENGPNSEKKRIKHLMQHDTWRPVGTYDELKEDSIGLRAVINIPDTTEGVNLVKNYEAGVFSEHSIGFGFIKDKYKLHEDGVGEFLEVKLFEGSTVTWGANANTPVNDIKSLKSEDVLLLMGNVQHAIKRGTFSDSMFVELYKLLDELQLHIKSLEIDGAGFEKSTSDLSAEEMIEAIKCNIDF